MSRIRPLSLVPPLAALALGGCVTHSVRPTPSKAILEARAHHTVAIRPNTCPELASPAAVEFGFEENALSELDTPALDTLTAGLACHPGVSAIVVGEADGHGTAAEQHKLAGERAQAVVADLQRRGVAAARLTSQVEGKEPAGDAQHVVILAQGRRW
ncbi:OmpA family protein [Phenylobacterium sp.]|uniref:OmpA family protein n=1 Tax=Phenylobacterium sp. TaxID=1871053 RepID=UPI002612B085|nr:OmpA family protein [Phenylobacterium sp.]